MDVEELKFESLSVNSPLKRSYTFRDTPTRKKGVGAYAFDRLANILSIVSLF